MILDVLTTSELYLYIVTGGRLPDRGTVLLPDRGTVLLSCGVDGLSVWSACTDDFSFENRNATIGNLLE